MLAVGASCDTLLQRGGFDPELEAQKNGAAQSTASMAPTPEPTQQPEIVTNEQVVEQPIGGPLGLGRPSL